MPRSAWSVIAQLDVVSVWDIPIRGEDVLRLGSTVFTVMAYFVTGTSISSTEAPMFQTFRFIQYLFNRDLVSLIENLTQQSENLGTPI